MKVIVWLSLILSCFGCSAPQAVDEASLISFVQDESNGLTKMIAHNDFSIILSSQPTDLIVKQQIKKGTALERDSLRQAYESYLYFVLRIEKQGKDLETSFAMHPESFAERIAYMTNSFPDNIVLVASSKRISPIEYIYVRSFGIGPSSMLLVFEKPKQKEFEIILDGYDIGFGRVRFSFDQDDLNETPQLKL